MNMAEIMPKPTTSCHRARVSKPNALRIEAPGTSMSSPYLWSMSVRKVTSLTIRPSKP
jgi:hypothetical protein